MADAAVNSEAGGRVLTVVPASVVAVPSGKIAATGGAREAPDGTFFARAKE